MGTIIAEENTRDGCFMHFAYQFGRFYDSHSHHTASQVDLRKRTSAVHSDDSSSVLASESKRLVGLDACSSSVATDLRKLREYSIPKIAYCSRSQPDYDARDWRTVDNDLSRSLRSDSLLCDRCGDSHRHAGGLDIRSRRVVGSSDLFATSEISPVKNLADDRGDPSHSGIGRANIGISG